MTTQRSTLVTAIRAALDAVGKPAGLTVTPRRAMPTEGSALPLTMVGRTKEVTVRATASKVSPVVKRTLTIRLDHWAAGDDPEETLEPLLAWATAQLLATPGWNSVAIETSEDGTEWGEEMLDQNFGHATQTFTVAFVTKTADQEQKQ
jgi:hypothetical protein